jgi:hypothetical protein
MRRFKNETHVQEEFRVQLFPFCALQFNYNSPLPKNTKLYLHKFELHDDEPVGSETSRSWCIVILL